MRTAEDKKKQAQAEINAAVAKRIRANRLLQEAEEDLIEARLKMEDAERELRARVQTKK